MPKFISDADMAQMETNKPSPKAGFISDEDMAHIEQETKPGIDPNQDLGFGASKTADVIGKGLEQVSDLVVNGIDSIPGVGYLKKAQAAVAAPLKGQSYEDTINGYNEDTKERWERSPGASATGAVALNPLQGVKGATMASRALQNGIVNSADAAGRGDAGLDGKGAAIGGVMGIGGSVLADSLPALAAKAKEYGTKGGEWLKNLAESLAVDTLNPILSQQERMNQKGTAKELGRAMLDEKAVRFGSRVDDVLPRVENILNREGDKIKDIRKAADAKGATVNLGELDAPALANFDKAKGMGTDAGTYADTFAREVENINEKPVRSMLETGELLAELGKSGKYNKINAPTKVDAVRDVRSGVKSLFDETLANIDPQMYADHSKARDAFSLFKDGDEILQKSVARQDKNAKIGLRDAMAGAAELAKQDNPEGLLKAARNALISKIVRERGNSVGAVAADQLGNLLIKSTQGTKFEVVLREALKRGPQALVAAHQALSSNPEYIQAVGGE